MDVYLKKISKDGRKIVIELSIKEARSILDRTSDTKLFVTQDIRQLLRKL